MVSVTDAAFDAKAVALQRQIENDSHNQHGARDDELIDRADSQQVRAVGKVAEDQRADQRSDQRALPAAQLVSRENCTQNLAEQNHVILNSIYLGTLPRRNINE